MYYRINAGAMSVNNGAIAPLKIMFDLASAMDTKVITGETYGQDYIRAPSDHGEQKVVESLLDDSRLVWEKVERLPYNLAGYDAEPADATAFAGSHS